MHNLIFLITLALGVVHGESPPGDLSRALSAARQNLRTRHLRQARIAIDRALAIDPDHPEAKTLLGELAGYEKVLEEEGSLPGKFLIWKTRNFEIHHHHPHLADRVAESAEKHLAYLEDAIAWDGFKKPRLKKFKIKIFRDVQEYSRNYPGEASRATLSAAISETEIISSQKVVLGALKHEITHLVVHAYLPNMPIWQCWSLFHFLQHAGGGRYRKGFHSYLREICRGGSGDVDAFEKHVAKIESLEGEFLAYGTILKPSSARR